MKNKIAAVLGLLIFSTVKLAAQVPVSEEPFHHLVLQNKYIRLIDAWILPGDTSQFHIHSTPSLFVYLSNTNMRLQIEGKEWTGERSWAGKAWYRSFTPDLLIHRVANVDTVALHVNDIEILSPYDTLFSGRKKSLPFTILFENEKSVAYQLGTATLGKNEIINHGPLIAVLVTGEKVVFRDAKTGQLKGIKAGEYLYIAPESAFNFISDSKSEFKLVLFEIK